MTSDTCTCGKSFRGGEDYRDHLPCPGSKEDQLRAALKRLIDRVLALQFGCRCAYWDDRCLNCKRIESTQQLAAELNRATE